MGNWFRCRGGRDAPLTREQTGVQAWKDHSRGATQRGQRGPRGQHTRISAWIHTAHFPETVTGEKGGGDTGSKGAPPGQAQGPEPRKPVHPLTCLSRAGEKAGHPGPGDVALPCLEGCSAPRGAPEGTTGEPRWGVLQPLAPQKTALSLQGQVPGPRGDSRRLSDQTRTYREGTLEEANQSPSKRWVSLSLSIWQ